MKKDMIWAVLVHLGTNLWFEEGNNKGDDGSGKVWKLPASSKLRFDLNTFDRTLLKFKECGVNTIILDIADGIVFESHPELAIDGGLSRSEVDTLLKKMRDLSFEVIPKLNFSATHDVWLKDYSRMVSSPTYYKVCEDLIKEVCDIFKPKYFHIGFDEEGIDCQSNYDYAVIRSNDLWWHDLEFFRCCVEREGARAMMWSDYARHHLEEFVERCPKSIVQCVWYYFNKFEGDDGYEELHEIRVKPYKALDENGFDQLPIGSNEYNRDNLERLVKYCSEVISPDRLLGFGTTTWAETSEKFENVIFDAAETVKESKLVFEKK